MGALFPTTAYRRRLWLRPPRAAQTLPTDEPQATSGAMIASASTYPQSNSAASICALPPDSSAVTRRPQQRVPPLTLVEQKVPNQNGELAVLLSTPVDLPENGKVTIFPSLLLYPTYYHLRCCMRMGVHIVQTSGYTFITP